MSAASKDLVEIVAKKYLTVDPKKHPFIVGYMVGKQEAIDEVEAKKKTPPQRKGQKTILPDYHL